MRSDIDKRVKALEARAQADQGSDEETRTRLFLSKITDEELDRLTVILERTQDGALPLTDEEQSFLDCLEAKYGSF
jgi:hypothetical protein